MENSLFLSFQIKLHLILITKQVHQVLTIVTDDDINKLYSYFISNASLEHILRIFFRMQIFFSF